MTKNIYTDEDIRQALTERVRALGEQARAAKEIGVSQQYVSDVLRGRRSTGTHALRSARLREAPHHVSQGAPMTSNPKLYRLTDMGGGAMRMASVENPAWHSEYDGEWVRWDEARAALEDEHLSLQAASEFIRDVYEAVHRMRPGQEDTVNLIELAKTVQQRLAIETPAPQFDIDEVDFIWNEMYASISNGADDPMFQRCQDKAMDIKRAHNAKRRAQKTAEDSRAPKPISLADQIAFIESELLDWAEDVAMGGGTGSMARENLQNDPTLQRACSKVDMYSAVLASLKRLSDSMPA